jgi:hypothetical protein
MTENKHRVARIKEEYYEEAVRKRISDLEKTFKEFQSEIANALPDKGGENNNFREIKSHWTALENDKEGTQWGIMFDNRLLRAALKSYVYDIIRYKEFHFASHEKSEEEIHKNSNNEDITSYKHLAYMVKWLNIHKPVILIPPKGMKNRYDKETRRRLRQFILDINFHFLFTYISQILAIDISKLQKKNLSEMRNTGQKLRYQLRYRPYNEGAFEIIFELMQKTYAPEKWEKENTG